MNKMTNNDIINTIGLQEELEDTKCIMTQQRVSNTIYLSDDALVV
jgi:hypothetical protein